MKIVRVIVCGMFLALACPAAYAQTPDAPDGAPASPSLNMPDSPRLLAQSDPLPPAPDGMTGGAMTNPADGNSTATLKLGTGNNPSAQSIDPKDIPDIVLEEMQNVEDNCRANYFYSSFHDCRCVAVKFVDARMRNDPAIPKERIFEQVATQCPDEPSIAGFIYKSCADYMKTIRKDYVGFCKCSANNVARAYSKTPVMNMRYIEGLRRNAFVTCGIGNRSNDLPYGGPGAYNP